MTTQITREVLESHLKCRYKGHLRLAGQPGDRSDYELLMIESRERVRQAATDTLLRRHKEGEVLQGLTATAALLKQGASLILDATVEGEGLAIRFDALLRAEGQSCLGEFHYLPVLF